MTKYETQYYYDIHRIADALEKLAQRFTIDEEETAKEELPPISTADSSNIQHVCPFCYSDRIHAMYGTINLDGSNDKTHYICEDCHKEFDINKMTQGILLTSGRHYEELENERN